MWKANRKTTTLQLFLDSLSPKNMRDASSGDKLKIALFGDPSLEEAMDLSRGRQILDFRAIHSLVYILSEYKSMYVSRVSEKLFVDFKGSIL
jgi:hypothetical protein